MISQDINSLKPIKGTYDSEKSITRKEISLIIASMKAKTLFSPLVIRQVFCKGIPQSHLPSSQFSFQSYTDPMKFQWFENVSIYLKFALLRVTVPFSFKTSNALNFSFWPSETTNFPYVDMRSIVQSGSFVAKISKPIL